MTREIIKKKTHESYEGLTVSGRQKALRKHLEMMLEAMQYTESTQSLTVESLRQLVEEQKIIFLRKLQADMELQNLYGRSA